MNRKELEFQVGERTGSVSAIFTKPAGAKALYVCAHGAGANMRHAFLESIADHLGNVGVAVFRYNFPYTESGKKSPDVPAVLEATVRAAINTAHELEPKLNLIAGGKSMGGRMTSQALSKSGDTRVQGLAFLGFPLHQPGKPSVTRAEHLQNVTQPMLFLQGTRDTLAQLDLMKELAASLGERATLHIIDDADHSFVVRKRTTGRTADDVHEELARTLADWAAKL